ncbi:MAG: hypothetical protein QE272_11535 [Nevskia sp.]|nr:hypothetical protein [Nevskia sp.]
MDRLASLHIERIKYPSMAGDDNRKEAIKAGFAVDLHALAATKTSITKARANADRTGLPAVVPNSDRDG